VAGTSRYFRPSTYQKVTGSPVHLLVGERDDFDEPGACEKFLAELPPAARPHFSMTVYPGATHGWDGVAGGAYYDVGAKAGKGGFVDVIADPAITQRSREFAVVYFRKHLAAE
jgi:dienelactone hydrolase